MLFFLRISCVLHWNTLVLHGNTLFFFLEMAHKWSLVAGDIKINEIFHILSALWFNYMSLVANYILSKIIVFCHFHCQHTWLVHPCWKKVENCSLMLSAVQPKSPLPLGVGAFSEKVLITVCGFICILVTLLKCMHVDLCKLRHLSHLLWKIWRPAIFVVFLFGHQ